MKLPPEERAANRAAFRAMNWGERLEYIFAYYKGPIILILCAAVVLGSVLHRQLTKKETLLWMGELNFAPGEALQEALTDGYVLAAGRDPRSCEVYLYEGLYVSADPPAEYHEYAYASRLKLMAAVNAGSLDVVLMNRESYDYLSGAGYLLELPELVSGHDPALHRRLLPYYTENQVVLSDNSLEVQLNQAETLEIVTEPAVNALEITHFPLFEAAGLTAPAYLGIIANSTRAGAGLDYAGYLLGEDG